MQHVAEIRACSHADIFERKPENVAKVPRTRTLSMAMASLVLPFLPLLPVQILLYNLFYDTSEIGIPFDNVEGNDLRRRWSWVAPEDTIIA